MKRLILALAILGFANCALAQTGGPTAPPPNGNQFATNQVTNSNFSTGSFTGYTAVNACAKVTSNNPFPGDAFSAEMNSAGALCAGGNVTIFQFVAALHNHENLLVRWQANASVGFVGTGISVGGLFDGTHGGGSLISSTGRQSIIISGPTGGWVQQFQETILNKTEHGSDSNINVHFQLSTPAWLANHAYALGAQIVDSNGNIETVTTAGTSGGSHPTWATGSGATTADGTGTLVWTNGGANPPVYVSHVEVEEDWFTIRAFVINPNYRGYEWTDIPPVSDLEHGTDLCGTTIGEICGVSEIDPPPSQTLSSVTDTETLQTSSTCAGGAAIKETLTFASPNAVQSWKFLPTSYGGLPTNGTAYYVCHALSVTAGGAPIDSYPQDKIIFEGAAFRASLNSFYMPSGLHIINGNPVLDIGVYDRFATLRCFNCVYTTKANYETSISGMGFGLAPPATTSMANTPYGGWVKSTTHQVGDLISINGFVQEVTSCSGSCITQAGAPTFNATLLGTTTDNAGANQVVWTNKGIAPGEIQGNVFADYSASHYITILKSFGTDSAISPWSGSAAGDQLTPENAAFADYGLNGWQILDNWMGYLVNENGISANPAAPSVTATTGNMTANFAFVEVVGAGSGIAQGDSPPRIPGLTAPSPVTTVNLSAAGCAGVNCGLVVTPNNCTTSRWVGTLIYAATNSTSTVPPQTSFFPLYPSTTLAGQLSPQDYIPCSVTSFTATSVQTSGPNPPTTDTSNTSGGRPSWSSTSQSDQTLWQFILSPGAGQGMCTSATPSGAGGIYEYDEVPFYGFPLGWEEYNYIKANCIQEPVSGVDIFGTKFHYTRNLMDVVGVDPYGFLVVPSPEEYVAGISTSATCALYRQNNQADTLSNQCFPSRIDLWTNELSRDTYGARPTWVVFKMYGSSSYLGYTYEPIHRQLWGAILGCRVYGNLGCSALGWGDVSAVGTENTWNKGDTQAWYDKQRAFGEVQSEQSILEQPVVDSSQMNAGSGVVSSGATVVGGQIISAVQTSVATATACDVQSGTTSIYTNTTLFPFGPVEFDASFDSANGDQRIHVLNLCDSSINVTFTLANPPAGQTNVQVLHGGGLPLAITSNQFTITLPAMATYSLAVRVPRGMTIGTRTDD